MCHPKRKLHEVKNQVVKKEVEKESESQHEVPDDSQYFFLMNEDILH